MEFSSGKILERNIELPQTSIEKYWNLLEDAVDNELLGKAKQENKLDEIWDGLVKDISFTGGTDTPTWLAHKDGVEESELTPAYLQSYVTEVCRDYALPYAPVFDSPIGSTAYHPQVGWFGDFINLRAKEIFKWTKEVGSVEIPIFVAYHEVGHKEAGFFGDVYEAHPAFGELYADASAVFKGAMEGIDLRDDAEKYRAMYDGGYYPNKDMVKAASDYAYDFGKQYSSEYRILSPEQRRDLQYTFYKDLKANAEFMTRENYKDNPWYQKRMSKMSFQEEQRRPQ